MTRGSIMLEFRDVTLKKGNKTILQNINLSIGAGEIYGILGPNGAGKSSLAYSIMGCDGYDLNGGEILFDGKNIASLNIWQRARLGITLAWQEPARFEGISVEDYLQLGMKKKKNGAEIREALQKVLLDPGIYLKRKVDKTLSGGERKRIELAAIFTMEPRLAILDEPDSGIDILALDKVMEIVRDLKAKGITVIIITHQIEVARISERAALIGEGFLVKEGSTREVVDYFENKCLKCDKYK
jgi:Fe-S cluster assembly ATP-binding protein